MARLYIVAYNVWARTAKGEIMTTRQVRVMAESGDAAKRAAARIIKEAYPTDDLINVALVREASSGE